MHDYDSKYFGSLEWFDSNVVICFQYAFFLFCLIVLQIVAAVVIFVYQDDFRKGLERGVRELFDNAQTNRDAIDAVQRTVSVCF